MNFDQIPGNAQGKDQKQGILGSDFPYIKRPLWDGEPLAFVVPKAVTSRKGLLSDQSVLISNCLS